MLSPWHQARREGLTSSDLAAIMGKSVSRSPWMVQREKLGLAPEPDMLAPSEDMFWGNVMEPLVAQTFAERLKLRLVEPWAWNRLTLGRADVLTDGFREHAMVFCDGAEVCRSTPDFLLDSPGMADVVEVKTTAKRDAWEHGPPRAVQLQAQWHMLCAGLRRTFVPVLFFGGSRKLKVYEIERAPEFESKNAKAAQFALKWWKRHVLNQEPIVPCALDIPWLTKQTPHGDGTTIQLPESFAALDIQYTGTRKIRDEERAQAKRAESTFRDVEAQLRAAIGKATFAEIQGVSGVTYSLHTGPKGGRNLRRKQRK